MKIYCGYKLLSTNRIAPFPDSGERKLHKQLFFIYIIKMVIENIVVN